jgi:phospholipid transport system transporter-binding protein
MVDAMLETAGEGRWRLSGDVGFKTVSRLLKESHAGFFDADEIEVDLSGVTRADSAGLALLVEWLRTAERGGRPISFVNMPAQMQSIARICGLDEILISSG